MVVDIRVSWPSAASLDFRLKTDNTPKMKLRLDRLTMMQMLIYERTAFQLDRDGNLASRGSWPQQPASTGEGILCSTFRGRITLVSIAYFNDTCLLDHNDVQAPQLGWNLSGFGSTVANSDYIDGIVSDLIQVVFFTFTCFFKALF